MSRRKKAEDQKQGDPMSVRVPKDIRALLDKEARKQDMTKHGLVVEILRKWQAFMTRKLKGESLK